MIDKYELEEALEAVLGCGPPDEFWQKALDGQYLEWKIEGDDLNSFFFHLNQLIHHVDPSCSIKKKLTKQTTSYEDAWNDLQERVILAQINLAVEDGGSEDNRQHRASKAAGVGLVLSYMNEYNFQEKE